jgi:hypothetical protein
VYPERSSCLSNINNCLDSNIVQDEFNFHAEASN